MNLLETLEDFFSRNFHNKSYIVGGYCRDTILGNNPKDIDIVIEEENGAERASILLANQNPNEVSYYKVGNSYPIYKVHFKTFNETVDIADSQSEYFPDNNSRQRLTKFASLEEDSARRDFTINKIYYNLTTKQYSSFCNAEKDLKSEIITCDNNPDIMFSNDPLRILRMCRFAIKYNFDINDNVLSSAFSNINRLDIISKERIQEELMKICNIPRGLHHLIVDFKPIFNYIFPWYKLLENTLQHPSINENDIRNIHLEGLYVSDHIDLCLFNMPNDYVGIIQLAVLFHDIGKLETRSVKDGKCRFINHENVGINIAKRELTLLKFCNNDIKTICKSIKFHMITHPYNLKTNKNIKKFIRDVGDYLDIILKVSKIDSMSCEKLKEDDMPFDIITDKIYTYKINMVTPIITGDDIITIYNEKPNEIIGLVKKACIDLQDNFGLNSKEKLVGFMKQFKHCQDFLSNYKRKLLTK